MRWIKMRVGLPDDPQVVAIAAALGVTEEHVVGCLLRVWGLADEHAVLRSCYGRGVTGPSPDAGGDVRKEGFLAYYTLDALDAKARLPGLARHMEAIGWLTVYPDGLGFPDWDTHNGTTGKERALAQKRMARMRRGASAAEAETGPRRVTPALRSDRNRSVTTEQNRTEQNKEEETPLTPLRGVPPAGGDTPAAKKSPRKTPAEDVPVPESLRTPAFLAIWADWLADRAARRKKLTERAARQQLAALEPLGPERAVECVRLSIANGWTGLFPERFQGPAVVGNSRPGHGRPSLDEIIAGIDQAAIEDLVFPERRGHRQQEGQP